QGVERGAGIEVAATLLTVLQGQQQLRHGHALFLEQVLVGMGEADLADRRRGLLVLQRQRTTCQAELPSPERDSAGGHDDDLLAAPAHALQVLHQGLQPGAVEPATALVNQQRGTDLDHDATRLGQQQGTCGRMAAARLHVGGATIAALSPLPAVIAGPKLHFRQRTMSQERPWAEITNPSKASGTRTSRRMRPSACCPSTKT